MKYFIAGPNFSAPQTEWRYVLCSHETSTPHCSYLDNNYQELAQAPTLAEIRKKAKELGITEKLKVI